MKENKYDDGKFFSQYSQMPRSVEGLRGAGEWHVLRQMLPDFQGKEILDLGCGFGWHCRYALEQGARSARGIDISEKMLQEARLRNGLPGITYECLAIEDYSFPSENFDIVISSLTFHYLESFSGICRKIYDCLRLEGSFIFSVEHPVFTAQGHQEWIYDDQGQPRYWPVDHYFTEGKRTARFLGEEVTKYHKTLTTYINGLIQAGFQITGLREPEPDPALFGEIPGLEHELRRPMMLLISATKK